MRNVSLHRPSRAVSVVAGAALVVAALAGCGGNDSESSGSSKDPVVVDVTFKDGKVTPSGERVDLAVGQELDLKVTADEPGEIHVHSDPEQELEYPAGTKTFTLDGFERPGQIVVESHTLDVVILQLEVK
jgi:hypothetical protein